MLLRVSQVALPETMTVSHVTIRNSTPLFREACQCLNWTSSESTIGKFQSVHSIGWFSLNARAYHDRRISTAPDLALVRAFRSLTSSSLSWALSQALRSHELLALSRALHSRTSSSNYPIIAWLLETWGELRCASRQSRNASFEQSRSSPNRFLHTFSAPHTADSFHTFPYHPIDFHLNMLICFNVFIWLHSSN